VRQTFVTYGSGFGIIAGLISGAVPRVLPSTSTSTAGDALALLYAASLLWTALLVVVIAVIATGLLRIARIPS
jgi:hypothetical protein